MTVTLYRRPHLVTVQDSTREQLPVPEQRARLIQGETRHVSTRFQQGLLRSAADAESTTGREAVRTSHSIAFASPI